MARAFARSTRMDLFAAVDTFLRQGNLEELARVGSLLAPLVKARRTADLINSPLAWKLVCDLYERAMPHESFLHFFWAWRALFGGLLATLAFPLPPARVYHTVSTGYAGLLAARAAVETGRPALITEHGIYTNERRIEILQADWIVDTVDKGFSLHDPRRDLRDFWTAAFEGYARTCYQACAEVLTLHEANQSAQLAMGANRARMRIIPNGVDCTALGKLPQAGADEPPTVALVGRVVPIKDIKTYLQAVHLLRSQFPDLRAWVLGPTDEQPEYFEVCKAMVADMSLSATALTFTGKVDVTRYFPRMHVNVLTSLSESQPLSMLESRRRRHSDGRHRCRLLPGNPAQPERRGAGPWRRRHPYRCRLARADRARSPRCWAIRQSAASLADARCSSAAAALLRSAWSSDEAYAAIYQEFIRTRTRAAWRGEKAR